jgi:SAM-dependent methyltransferase
VTFVKSSREIIPKAELIRSLCQGKDVLDLGCLNHGWRRALELGDDWPHKQLANVARSLVGLDILGEDARVLNERGYNILLGSAESFNLDRTFDVVVCGDLIEHLSNPGRFLESAALHMHEESVCVITTPNPFNIEQALLAVFDNRIAVNPEHTVWIDPHVMYELVSRSPLRISGFHWIRTQFEYPVTARLYGRIARILAGYVIRKRPICNRDYAVILQKRPAGRG